MMKAQSSALVASGDTTKTLIETLQVPQNARMIVGIWAYACAAAAITTAEQASGILELESPDINIQPLQLPLDIVGVLTSGAFSLSPRIFPANIPVSGGERISGYVTMDVAQTGAFKARFGFIYEVPQNGR